MKKIALLFVVAAMATACGEKKGTSATDAEGQVNTEAAADQAVDPTVINNPSTATEPTAAVDPDNAPMITFEKDHVELKPITEGESVEVVYTYTNTGKANLVLSAVEPTCGCTVADEDGWSKEPLAPGGKGKIKVKYNSEGRGTGQINKSVMIKSNALAPDDIKELKFTVQVNPKK